GGVLLGGAAVSGRLLTAEEVVGSDHERDQAGVVVAVQIGERVGQLRALVLHVPRGVAVIVGGVVGRAVLTPVARRRRVDKARGGLAGARGVGDRQTQA